MKKTCDDCSKKRNCNTFDRSRGMPCIEFKKEDHVKNKKDFSKG